MTQDKFKNVKAKEGINKKDRYFFLALSFAQLGVVCLVVVFNSWYWHIQTGKNKEVYRLKKYAEHLLKQNDELSAKVKMDQLKRNYEGRGIGVEVIEK